MSSTGEIAEFEDPRTEAELDRVRAAAGASLYEQVSPNKKAVDVALPSVGRIVHYYGKLMVSQRTPTAPGQATCDIYVPPIEDSGPFAAWVIDVGPGPRTVTLKVTDRSGRDHVRANVEYGDSGWMWPPHV